ncbi:MAG TPA: DUF6515 family protein [Steroidobacteraceae bacterium]|jgi:hypothetical protein|nr:DUF6515 family protein [Steroidobacteraceae bacterium]
MKQTFVRVAACAALIAAGMLALPGAQAQDRGFRPGGRAPEHMDPRFAHNHYYPNRGAYIGALPGRPFIVNRPGGRFFYSGGVWYAPYGPRFVVVAAPLGVFVPVLPPYYTTVWFGGMPYYYANDTYYTWDAGQNGYVTVDPPGTEQSASTEAPQPPPPQGDDLYVYPQQGQSAEQQANDKYECHKWSASQSGFDPTQSSGGVPPDQLNSKRADYQRAMRACLEGRGYSAR